MQGINHKRVTYLYETVNAGAIRTAADKLNVAASAISRHISLLEKELDCQLIERHKNGVVATQAGNVLIGYYHEAQSSQENCISKLNALQGLQQGHIKLVIGEGFVSDLMMGPLSEFSAKYPNISLSIQLAGSSEVIHQIETDEAHIGILFHPANHPSIRSHVISKQPICVVVNPNHDLAKINQDKPLTLQNLNKYPFALSESSYGVRQLIDMAEFKQRVRINSVLTTNSIAVLKHFVQANMGITLLPEFVVSSEIADQKLVVLPLVDDILNSGEAHMITRLGRQLPNGAQALLTHLTQWMKAFA